MSIDSIKMKSSDIVFEYHAEEYERIETLLRDNGFKKINDIQLLFALFGLNNNSKIDLKEKFGTKIHTFSRVSYDKYSFEYDINFGLITILKNNAQNYKEVLNKMAFLKNGVKDEAFSSLINVKTFYEYFLGGIVPFFEILNEDNINDSSDVFSVLFDYVTDEDNMSILNEVIAEIEG